MHVTGFGGFRRQRNMCYSVLVYVYKDTCNIDEMWSFANLWIPWIVAGSSLTLDKISVYGVGNLALWSHNHFVWLDTAKC